MFSSQVLKDVGLALLAVLTVLAAGYVLLREPNPTDVEPLSAPVVATSSPSATPTVSAGPTSLAVDALLLRSAGTPSGHLTEAGRVLGWRVSGASLQQLPQEARLAQQEVVVVQSGLDDQELLPQVVQRLRTAAPAARLVVLAPLTGPTVGRQLGQSVQGARTEVLDPVGLGWVEGPNDFTPTGSLTAEAATSVGARLAAAL